MSSQVARSNVMSGLATSPSPSPVHRVGTAQHAWSVIVPVKQTTLGKSRLTGLADDERRALAVAFALDTVAAAVAADGVRRVVVVTNDPGADAFLELGAEVLADVPDAGLNPAIVHGAHQVAAQDVTTGLVALTADLPALTPEVLSAALAASPAPRWFVPDALGSGTTLLAAERERLAPAFGSRSRQAHRDSGAVELDMAGLHRLRQDVDTAADLWGAVRLGVGAHTSAVLARRRRAS
ncbi:MAG TPA: 2-phospho-L-lactate guanylyltransferase [Nocardioidaceae bacterium]